MTAWEPATLATIDADGEMTVAAHRPDGSLRTPRIVWHVVVDGELFIRSVRGEDGAWYRGVRRTGTGEIVAGGELFGNSAARRSRIAVPGLLLDHRALTYTGSAARCRSRAATRARTSCIQNSDGRIPASSELRLSYRPAKARPRRRPC